MSNIANSSVVKDCIRFAVTAKDGSTYCFGSAGSVYAISGNPNDPVVSGVYNDENGEIRGAAEWQLNDGNNYLYWATATSVARMALNGSVDTPWAAGVVTQDYKTTLDNHSYHAMKVANGVLCIANGDFLATFEYDGEFNPAAMNIRPGNIIKCLEERDDYIIIGSERKDTAEEGYIWTWILDNLSWSQKRRIPVRGINALIDTERLLLQGGSDGEIFFSDFSNVAPLNSVYSRGKCNNQVGVYNDLALFGMYGCDEPSVAGLYSYGRRSLNRPFAFNNEFRLTRTIAGSTVSEIGGTWMASSAVFASWKTTDESTLEYGVDMASSSTRATARYEGLEWDGGAPHLKKKYITEKLTFLPLPSGCSISFLFKKDCATTGGDSSAGAGWKYAKIANGTSTSYSVEGSTEAEFIINETAKVFETAIELTPSGSYTPEIISSVGYINDVTLEH